MLVWLCVAAVLAVLTGAVGGLVGVLLVGGLEGYFDQVTSTSCEACNEMVPIDAVFCPECGTRRDSLAGRAV